MSIKKRSILVLSIFILTACAPTSLPGTSTQAALTVEAAVADLAPTLDAAATQYAPTLQAMATALPPTAEVLATAAATPAGPGSPIPFPGVTAQYEGKSILVPQMVAQGAVIAEVPEHLAGAEASPEMSYPEHYEISFTDYQHAEAFHTPIIYIWPIEDYNKLDQSEWAVVSKNVDALRSILAGQSIPVPPNASEPYGEGLPFLPLWNAGSIFTAQLTRFPFASGDGIRYLTMYGQALNPISNHEVFYTYQGLTRDGEYYVAAVLPIAADVLPEMPETPANYDQFLAEYPGYLVNTVDKLDALPPGAFKPSLEALDAMMASLKLDN